MSHLTQSMVEQFFELEKESARGVLRKEMDSAMDTIFKQMKQKLMQLVESGPGPDDTAHGLDHFADPQHHQQQLYVSSNQMASTSTNVDDVASNNEKGSENAGTDLEGQEGEHIANDSNEHTQSSNLLAPSTSTGQSSNRIDVSSSPPETVQSSNVNQEHLDAQCDHSEQQLDNGDTSTRVDDVTSNNEKENENACTVLEDQEREHMANDSNYQTVAQSSDLFSPSTSTGPRSNRFALKKQLPTVSTHLNVAKRKEPSSNGTVKRSKKTIDDDVGEDGENELDRLGSEQSEAEFWFDEDDDCDCSECMDEYVYIAHLAVDLEKSNHSGSRPTKRARRENDLEQGAMLESSDNARHVPSISTGRKRQSSSTSRSVNNKPRTRSKKFLCKSPGCGKSFRDDKELSRHEHIHLGIKPFSCTWPDCKYASEQRPIVIRHVRSVHFKLPQYVKKQNELNIEDDRDPNEFVRVDQQLANRRL